MKKIGIITFHSAHNYGAMLQAFALHQKIYSLNKDNIVEIINYRNRIIDDEYKLFKIEKRGIKYFIKKFIFNILFIIPRLKRRKAFNEFMNTKMNLSKETYLNEEELKKGCIGYDYCITGSDQIWNTQITQGLQDSYALNFDSNKTKKISYAASIGNDQITEDDKNIFKDKLSKLDYISVREETAKSLLEPIINKKVEVVLDPTLLLSKKEWEKAIEKILPMKDKYIFAYRVGEGSEYKKIVKFLAGATGLKIIYVEAKKEFNNALKNAYAEGPLEFVNYIKNAEYIVTNSFHGTVFSIIFEKKFFVIPHSATGSRVTDLLKKLNLEDRVFYSLKEFEAIEYNRNMDYAITSNILKKERKKSIEYLKETLDIKGEIDN